MISVLLLAAVLAQTPDAGCINRFGGDQCARDAQTSAHDAQVLAGFVASTVGVAEAQADLGRVLDGGTTGLAALYVECPDAPPMVEMDGGFFVPTARQRRQNCKQVALENWVVPRLAEEQGESHPGTVLLIVGGGVLTFSLGLAVGYELPHPR